MSAHFFLLKKETPGNKFRSIFIKSSNIVNQSAHSISLIGNPSALICRMKWAEIILGPYVLDYSYFRVESCMDLNRSKESPLISKWPTF